MSNYTRCEICDEYGWTGTHVCPPKWICYDAEEPENSREVYALKPRYAAEKYAERIDPDREYQILKDSTESNEETEIVVVTEHGEERFMVAAEIIYQYSARRKEEDIDE